MTDCELCKLVAQGNALLEADDVIITESDGNVMGLLKKHESASDSKASGLIKLMILWLGKKHGQSAIFNIDVVKNKDHFGIVATGKVAKAD